VKTHELKIWPEYFNAIVEGRKTFEIRWNDRAFQEGDSLNLREWEPLRKRYSGRRLDAEITYVIVGPAWDLPEGMAVMSIKLLRSWAGAE